MPDDSRISCLFVPLQDQKHLGKESLHVRKKVKTCHLRNRDLRGAIAKLHYTKTPLFSCASSLYALTKYTDSKQVTKLVYYQDNNPAGL